jgi:hypothetical protein
MGTFIRKLILPASVLLISSCALVEDPNNVQIVQFDYFYPIRNHKPVNDAHVYNVIDIEQETKCGQSRVMVSPASLKMDEAAFIQQWNALRADENAQHFYKLTYGECIDDGVLVTKIVDCSSGKCGKEYQTDASNM